MVYAAPIARLCRMPVALHSAAHAATAGVTEVLLCSRFSHAGEALMQARHDKAAVMPCTVAFFLCRCCGDPVLVLGGTLAVGKDEVPFKPLGPAPSSSIGIRRDARLHSTLSLSKILPQKSLVPVRDL